MCPVPLAPTSTIHGSHQRTADAPTTCTGITWMSKLPAMPFNAKFQGEESNSSLVRALGIPAFRDKLDILNGF